MAVWYTAKFLVSLGVANQWYPKGVEGIGTKQVDLVNDDIRAILIDTAQYTFSTAHDFLNDVPAGARVATAQVTGRTMSGITFDAADTPFGVVGGGANAEAVILYQHTGNEATARLLLYIDSAGGLPLNPGADTTIQWNAAGIADL